jgi:hypothetical protein
MDKELEGFVKNEIKIWLRKHNAARIVIADLEDKEKFRDALNSKLNDLVSGKAFVGGNF